jgi:hypothetical protein
MVLSPQTRNLLLSVTCLLLASCESKVSQCQKIIKVHNQIVLDTQKLTNAGTKGDTATVLKSAEVFAKGAEAMGAIEPADDKLKELKNQFATMYQNSSQITKQILDSQTKKKSSDVAQGLAKLSQVGSPEKNLVDSINSYCGGDGSSTATSSPNSEKK